MGFRKHQERIAKLFEGQVNKISKGPDIQSDNWTIECKEYKDAFSISTHTWEKIFWEAHANSKQPIIVLTLKGMDDRVNKDLAIIDLALILEKEE